MYWSPRGTSHRDDCRLYPATLANFAYFGQPWLSRFSPAIQNFHGGGSYCVSRPSPVGRLSVMYEQYHGFSGGGRRTPTSYTLSSITIRLKRMSVPQATIAVHIVFRKLLAFWRNPIATNAAVFVRLGARDHPGLSAVWTDRGLHAHWHHYRLRLD